ncbi:hypothetical protein VZT92_007041 [Zoarces viviparus]|uniref:Uncharacterized protein n=1 Tax=Zoarces viviparus TaxID=48416 RepID=A0AAW1FIU0_ZOAVI
MKEVTDQQQLAAVLEDTVGGLEKLDCFLDAVEKLAVTSLHVFTVEKPVLHLPEGISPEHVQVVIFAARMICPLLLKFKRDASVFFLPKLQNMEGLIYQLNEYIQTTLKICGKLEKSSLSDFCLEMNVKPLVDLDVGLSEDEMQRMLRHINQLKEIRDDQPFRMVFLFQEVSCSDFISEFNKRRPGMLQSLEDLEQCAVQLDRMNKLAKISSVAGSSVGAAGGLLAMAGLALIPFTAGLSLGLIIGGTTLGVTSGVNSVVTTTTEIGVNCNYQDKASESFKSFMENVQIIQDSLRKVYCQPGLNIQLKAEYDKVFPKMGSVGRGIMSLITEVSAIKAVQKANALRRASRVSSEIINVGRASVKGSLALSNTARKFNIGLNALFIGMDVFFIVKDSISLAKGSETEVSQFIRARAALWCSEMESWQKIYDFLCKGLLTSEKNKAVLETPFYPERKI